jgi:outer membrane lipoprotein-sorting protein
MKNYLIAVLFLTCFSTITFAQKDSKAKELLDKSSKAFLQSGDIKVSFTMNIKDITHNTTESFDGQISLKGNKFFIEVPGRDIYFDGKTQWIYEKSYEEVNISEPKGQEIQALNPAFIFELYKRGCNYKYVGGKTDVKMRKVQEITLIPKDVKKSDIKRVDMQVNETDFMPVFFHVFFNKNYENIVYVNKYQANLDFPDSLFVFDAKKHPDAEIIDLRTP